MKRYNEKKLKMLIAINLENVLNVAEEENKIFNYGLTNLFVHKSEMWKQ